MGILISIAWLVVVILVLVDVITRDQSRIRYLDKTMWIIIVIIIPLIGSILWFTIGREWDRPGNAGGSAFGSFGDPRRTESLSRNESLPQQRALSTAEELAAIEREIEYHENQARIRRLETELEARRSRGSGQTPSQ